MSATRDQLGNVLKIQIEVWRHGAVRREAAKSFGRRERQTEEAVSGADVGQCHVARHQFKKMVTPVAKRNTVVHLCEAHGVSQRRACDVLQVDRSSVRYLSRRGDDAELWDAIKRVSRERRRFGYRRVHVMVTREGFAVSHKKVMRIYTGKSFRCAAEAVGSVL